MIIFGESDIFDFVIGVLLFGLGLFSLYQQDKTLDAMVNRVVNVVLEEENLYQLGNINDISKLPDEELNAIIVGYREFPISIDGTVMAPDDTDYNKYLSLIKEGYYAKSYQYDSNRKIMKVMYKHLVSM